MSDQKRKKYSLKELIQTNSNKDEMFYKMRKLSLANVIDKVKIPANVVSKNKEKVILIDESWVTRNDLKTSSTPSAPAAPAAPSASSSSVTLPKLPKEQLLTFNKSSFGVYVHENNMFFKKKDVDLFFGFTRTYLLSKFTRMINKENLIKYFCYNEHLDMSTKSSNTVFALSKESLLMVWKEKYPHSLADFDKHACVENLLPNMESESEIEVEIVDESEIEIASESKIEIEIDEESDVEEFLPVLPPRIELEEHEKFKGKDGVVLDFHVHGYERKHEAVVIVVKSVEVALGLANNKLAEKLRRKDRENQYRMGSDLLYYSHPSGVTTKISKNTPLCFTWTGLQKYLHNSVKEHAKAYVEWANKTLFKDEVKAEVVEEFLPVLPPRIELEEHEKFKGKDGVVLDFDIHGNERKHDKVFITVKSVEKTLSPQSRPGTLAFMLKRNDRDVKYEMGVDMMYFCHTTTGCMSTKSQNTLLCFTWQGLQKYLHNSVSKHAKAYVEWANKTLFKDEVTTEVVEEFLPVLPPKIELLEHEKFKGKDGVILDFDIHGQERKDNSVFITVKSVEKCLNHQSRPGKLADKLKRTDRENQYEMGVDMMYFRTTPGGGNSISRFTPLCFTWQGLQKYLHNSVSKHAKAYVEWANKTLFKDEVKAEVVEEFLPVLPPRIELEEHEKFKGKDGVVLDFHCFGSDRKHDCVVFTSKSVCEALGKKHENFAYDIKHATSDGKNLYVSNIDYGYYANTDGISVTKKRSRMTPFCFTWQGLQKYLHNSVSKHAKAYVEWANKTLFTVQMGSIEDKMSLVDDLLNTIDLSQYLKSRRMIMPTGDNGFPCVYAINFGKVECNLEALQGQVKNLDLGKYGKYHIVKYGKTKEDFKRISDYKNNSKTKGYPEFPQKSLIALGEVPEDQLFLEEQDFKDNFINNRFVYPLQYRTHKELLLVDPVVFEQMGSYLKKILKKYKYMDNHSLQNLEITELKTRNFELQSNQKIMSLENQLQLQEAERKVAEAEKEREKSNLLINVLKCTPEKHHKNILKLL
eukprot:Pgem_evm4s14806